MKKTVKKQKKGVTSVKGTDRVAVKLPSVDVYEQDGCVVISGVTLKKLAARCKAHVPALPFPDGISVILNEDAAKLCDKEVGQPDVAIVKSSKGKKAPTKKPSGGGEKKQAPEKCKAGKCHCSVKEAELKKGDAADASVKARRASACRCKKAAKLRK